MGLAFTVLYLFFFGLFLIVNKVGGGIQAKKLYFEQKEYSKRYDYECKKYKEELTDDALLKELQNEYKKNPETADLWRAEYYDTLGLDRDELIAQQNTCDKWRIQGEINIIPIFHMVKEYGKVPCKSVNDAFPFELAYYAGGWGSSRDYKDDIPSDHNIYFGSEELHVFYQWVSAEINREHPDYYICRYTVYDSYGAGYYNYMWNVFGDLKHLSRMSKRYQYKCQRTPISELSRKELRYYGFNRWEKLIDER